MRNTIFFFIIFLYVGSIHIGCGSDVSEPIETQVIKTLFNTIKRNELKNENFGAIISSNVQGCAVPTVDQPTVIIAWFKYRSADNDIVVNYSSFPLLEKYEDLHPKMNTNKFIANEKSIKISLKNIVQNKKIVNIEDIKQFKVSMPMRLQNTDSLIRLIRKNRSSRLYHGQIDGEFHYWGFKTNKMEVASSTKLHSYEFNKSIIEEIIYNVLDDIYLHETPFEWRKAYIEDYHKKEGFYPPDFDLLTLEVMPNRFTNVKDYQKWWLEQKERLIKK